MGARTAVVALATLAALALAPGCEDGRKARTPDVPQWVPAVDPTPAPCIQATVRNSQTEETQTIAMQGDCTTTNPTPKG